jgi:hypothetical protein
MKTVSDNLFFKLLKNYRNETLDELDDERLLTNLNLSSKDGFYELVVEVTQQENGYKRSVFSIIALLDFDGECLENIELTLIQKLQLDEIINLEFMLQQEKYENLEEDSMESTYEFINHNFFSGIY